MRVSANHVQSAGRAGPTAAIRAPAFATSSAVLFWIALLPAGLATGVFLAQSARYILGS